MTQAGVLCGVSHSKSLYFDLESNDSFVNFSVRENCNLTCVRSFERFAEAELIDACQT